MKINEENKNKFLIKNNNIKKKFIKINLFYFNKTNLYQYIIIL